MGRGSWPIDTTRKTGSNRKKGRKQKRYIRSLDRQKGRTGENMARVRDVQ